MSAVDREAEDQEWLARQEALVDFKERTAGLTSAERAKLAADEAAVANSNADRLIAAWERTPDGIAVLGAEKRAEAHEASVEAARACAVAEEMHRQADLEARLPERVQAFAEKLKAGR